MSTPPGQAPGSWGVPGWLRRVGLTSWLLLGIAGAIFLAALLLALTQGITIPLLVAVIVGAVFVPWVDGLRKLGVPRWLGSLIYRCGHPDCAGECESPSAGRSQAGPRLDR